MPGWNTLTFPRCCVEQCLIRGSGGGLGIESLSVPAPAAPEAPYQCQELGPILTGPAFVPLTLVAYILKTDSVSGETETTHVASQIGVRRSSALKQTVVCASAVSGTMGV